MSATHRRLAVALLLAGLLAASCSDGSSTDDPPDAAGEVTVTVIPDRALLDEPLAIQLDGLGAGERAEVSVRSTGAEGLAWVSEATFEADASGTVDVTTAEPIEGSYTEADPMGLFTSLRPTDISKRDVLYLFDLERPSRFAIEVRAEDGRRASTRVERRPADDGVVPAPTTLEADGFVGRYWSAPAEPDRPQPAIVALGGSEGGLPSPLPGPLLASRGIAVLDVAYFDAPGLPDQLSDIPLEYFVGALEWLRRRPEVDPDRVWVLGGSRGSEAALLLGANFPELVGGVVGSVPSSVVYGANPLTGRPAWTLRGEPVPFNRGISPAAIDNAETVIPVERIDGPVFLACGEGDSVWDSCAYSRAIAERLDELAPEVRYEVASYPEAGHGLGALVPYLAAGPLTAGFQGGGTPPGNKRARADVWPRLLEFLGADS